MNQLCACRSLSGAFLLTALCGLFSVPPTHAQEDVRRATPPPGKALVFVFRIDPKPVAAQVPVIVNTVRVGELANGTFISATVGPGRNYLQIGDRAPSTLVVEANRSYFVRVGALGNPPSVRTEVSLVSEDEGRGSLAQSRFAGVAPAAVTTAPPPKPSPAPVPLRHPQAVASTGHRCATPQAVASTGSHCATPQAVAAACCNATDSSAGDVHPR